MIKCVICGKEIKKSSFSHKTICGDECFRKDFWLTIATDYKTNKRRAVISGWSFYIGDENDRGGFRGFGGAKCIIRFNDGREVVSTNLWTNGLIPNEFRNMLPDNAIFLERNGAIGNCDSVEEK